MEQTVTDDLLSVVRAGDDWEAAVFEAACGGARDIASQLLALVDDALYEGHDPGLPVEGYRTRAILTRMGPVHVRRRLYRAAGAKRCRFLLAEVMGWTRGRVLSPSLPTSPRGRLARPGKETPFSVASPSHPPLRRAAG